MTQENCSAAIAEVLKGRIARQVENLDDDTLKATSTAMCRAKHPAFDK